MGRLIRRGDYDAAVLPAAVPGPIGAAAGVDRAEDGSTGSVGGAEHGSVNAVLGTLSQTEDHADVHAFFGLSYASYLVVNRSLLQSMPLNWQHRFVDVMDELWDQFPDIEEPIYTVHARSRDGRFIRDAIPHYDRGRTFVAGRYPVKVSA